MKWKTQANCTLFEALTQLAPGSSKTKQRQWLKSGRLTINCEKVLKSKQTLQEGDILELLPSSREEKTPVGGIPILYKDNHLIVLNKPASLLSVSTETEIEQTLHTFLKKSYPRSRIGIIHRLDRETSGVIIFSLSDVAYHRLKEALKERKMKRRYCAVVENGPPDEEGVWSCYLDVSSPHRVFVVPDEKKGVLAKTSYKVVKRGPLYTLLSLYLDTGKRNQIRAHCEMAGLPIAGDAKYGATTTPIGRVALHAEELAFAHPLTGRHMQFNAPLPRELTQLVGRQS